MKLLFQILVFDDYVWTHFEEWNDGNAIQLLSIDYDSGELIDSFDLRWSRTICGRAVQYAMVAWAKKNNRWVLSHTHISWQKQWHYHVTETFKRGSVISWQKIGIIMSLRHEKGEEKALNWKNCHLMPRGHYVGKFCDFVAKKWHYNVDAACLPS